MNIKDTIESIKKYNKSLYLDLKRYMEFFYNVIMCEGGIGFLDVRGKVSSFYNLETNILYVDEKIFLKYDKIKNNIIKISDFFEYIIKYIYNIESYSDYNVRKKSSIHIMIESDI